MADSKDKKGTASKAKTSSARKTTAADTETTPAVIKSAQTTSTLPTKDDLKNRFKAGSIPLQSDFADLIDMANAGAQAAGQASGQSGAGKGLALTSGLLEVNAGNGITVTASGVSIDPTTVLPKGIITMFNGSTAPIGWAFCDGENDTPDLRDRFIVGKGSKFASSGSGTTATDPATVKGTISVSGTTLTNEHLPSHQHDVELNSFYYVAKVDSSIFGNVVDANLNVLREGKDPNGTTAIGTTKSSGGGKSHTHSASVTTDPHSHNISPIPPYYALAFIMKL